MDREERRSRKISSLFPFIVCQSVTVSTVGRSVVQGFYERPVREFPLLSTASYEYSLFLSLKVAKARVRSEGERTSAGRYTVTAAKRDTRFSFGFKTARDRFRDS